MLALTGGGVIVTGAANGIGRAAAERFAAEGARVLLADLNEAEGEAAAAGLRAAGHDAAFQRVDVADEAEVAALVREAQARFGRLDVVVHAAGILLGAYRAIEELDLETWNRVLAVNLTGTFLCAKYAAGPLAEARGAFLCLASGAGVRGGSSSLAYGASKGGVNGLMMTLAPMLQARGVRAHVLCPGSVNTPMKRQNLADALAAGRPPASVAAVESLADPAGIANLLFFLATDEGGFVQNPIFTR